MYADSALVCPQNENPAHYFLKKSGSERKRILHFFIEGTWLLTMMQVTLLEQIL